MTDRSTGFFSPYPIPEKENSHFFALVLYAPPEVSKEVDDIRRRYDPAIKEGIPTHLTIKRPAILPESQFLPLIDEEIKTVCKEISPFQVNLDGYSLFKKPGRNVVYLKVRDEKPLDQLHLKMLEALGKVIPGAGADQYEGQGFHPHLTIGNFLSDLELAVMEYELGKGDYRLNFSFEISKITLLDQPPGGLWKTVNSYILGEEKI